MRLETERLILREFTIDDLDAFAWLMADPEVMRFSLSGPMKDKAQVKEYFHAMARGFQILEKAFGSHGMC
jgi:RimJ/RimL family protein N-acetyltransferase